MIDDLQSKVGFINLFKPAGMSSFDCIRALRRILHTRKMGHLGTLDPLADGVLPIAIGKATKLIEYLEKSIKVYQAVFQLGLTTETDDIEGKILHQATMHPIDLKTIERALEKYQGTISQVPPAVSAVHVEGKRAYDLVRSGKTIDLEPRTVRIFEIKIVHYDFPLVVAEIRCSPGTYIRSIARDLGRDLGIGAVIKKLRRLQSGQFLIEDSVTLEQVEEAAEKNLIKEVLSDPLKVMNHIPRIYVNEPTVEKIKNGGAIPVENISKIFANTEENVTEDMSGKYITETGLEIFLVLDHENNILAVAKKSGEDGYAPVKVLITTETLAHEPTRNRVGEV